MYITYVCGGLCVCKLHLFYSDRDRRHGIDPNHLKYINRTRRNTKNICRNSIYEKKRCTLNFSFIFLIFLPKEPPERGPSITGIKSEYKIGDFLQGNCSSFNSKPSANLTWMINNILVKMFIFFFL